jgi:allantoinase
VPTYDTIIRNGTIVSESEAASADIAIDGGVLAEIGPELAGDAADTIDASGLHIFPGIIDAHVHFNEPGRTHWEGFATGSAAMAAGGGTCFFDMPLNSSPPVLDGQSFDLKLAAARARSVTDFALWGGLTADNLDRLEEMAGHGVIGFKAFMASSGIVDFPRVDDDALYRGMEIAARLDLPVAVHAEDEALTSRLAAEAQQAHRLTLMDFAQSRPVAAEVEAIGRAIRAAQSTGCRLHIVHVSSEAGARVAAAGRRTTDVTWETCAHYFLLSETDFPRIGALAKCAPPIRTPADADYLRTSLAGGDIDFVASDHSPSPPSMKAGENFFEVWGGIAGVQSTLAAVLTIEPSLPPQLVARCTSRNVASRFRIPRKGRIAAGCDADLVLVDLQRHYHLTREMLLDRHKLSPYIGRRFRGAIRRTLVRGVTVFSDGRIVSTPIGQLVKPA